VRVAWPACRVCVRENWKTSARVAIASWPPLRTDAYTVTRLFDTSLQKGREDAELLAVPYQ